MEPLITQLVKALGWSILHSLWQAAIIYALLFISFMLFANQKASTKHNIAFGALLLTFISFCVTFLTTFELPTAQTNAGNVQFTQFLIAKMSNSSNGFLVKAEAYFPILAIIYIVGLVSQASVLGFGYARLKKLKSQFLAPIPKQWNEIFQHTLQQLAIKKNVSFFLSPKINVPLVIGFFKPVVLFPVAMATQLDIKHVEAILIHELSHIRRNDYLLNLIKTTVEILMFFNPFVWLTTKLINVERENACDDLVVSVTQTPVTYAHALLNIELLKNKNTPALSLAASGDNQHLYQRIKRITNMKSNYINIKQHALILTLAVTTVVSLAWVNPTKKQENKKKPNLKIATINPENACQITFRADTDSVKVKEKVKIVITDKSGKESVYHSMKEVPDSIKNRVFKSAGAKSIFGFDTAGLAVFPNGKFDFEIHNQFNSPEFHLKMEKFGKDMEKMGKNLDKQFNSPEFKAKTKALEDHFNSPEFKAKIKGIEESYNSPEFKAKMEELRKSSVRIGDLYSQKFTEDFRRKSEESRKKNDELKKLYNSEDYKKLRQKYEKDLEKLKKKNGLSTEKAFLLMNNEIESAFAFVPQAAEKPAKFSFASPAALGNEIAIQVAAPTAAYATAVADGVVKATSNISSVFATSGDVKSIKIFSEKEAKEQKEKQ